MVQESDSNKGRKILEAAARLMGQKSFKDVSMDELAAEAGVAKGTLYLYYRNKGDIYISLIMEGVSELAALLETVAQQKFSTARQKLEAILDTSLNRFGDALFSTSIPILSLPGANSEEIEGGLKRDFFPVLNSLKSKLAAIFKQGIRSKEFRKLDPFRLAGVFLHLLEYCYVHTLLVADSPTDPADEIPFIKDLFFKGILT